MGLIEGKVKCLMATLRHSCVQSNLLLVFELLKSFETASAALLEVA